MKHLIHDAPGFRLEAVITRDPYCGTTVELFSTWPKANHPDPHRLLTLSLPAESFHRLAEVARTAAEDKVQ
jgi:hypothetical protein